MDQMRPAPGKILLVDDEPNIRAGLEEVLRRDGHEVWGAPSAEGGLAELARFEPEVAVLDIRLPGMSGTALLAALKEKRPHLAVIMLTGHGTLETAMAAVKAGAFDYLLKPARPDALREVVGRALAAGRREREQQALLDSLQAGLQRLRQLPAGSPPEGGRQNHGNGGDLLRSGPLVINKGSYEAVWDGEALTLTPTEYGLLLALAERDGAVIDYVTLARIVLDYEAEPWEAKELIKRHVYTLRQKVEPQPEIPRHILNVRGVGYRLAT